ncbi:hypothetical protein EXE10_00040 [Acinetobacter sp. WCHAc060033]|uniref:hypothetical protein n=1 Tax=Acinetobacter TaxID=469 RepID=UPI001023DC42|nr:MULTISPECIES: hypothetical protein [Acinetobacter]RZG72660.1 hypothetical protein EXU29_09130 [Acinetobacter wuhouensis]RZG92450.1 hypothetical protein EXE10_00040 [Acinetobacter sp. WCHAc060033]
MGTFSNISIQHLSICSVIDEIKHFYKITYQLSLPIIQEWYLTDHNKKIHTIVVSCNHSIYWVDINFPYHDLTDPLIFDFLIYLSKKYKTTVLLGKLKTTTAEAQFIKLENGVIQYHIAQNLIEEQIVITQKSGLENSDNIFKSDFPEIGQAFDSDIQEFLDLDDWNNFFGSCNREYTFDSSIHIEEYFHLRWHKEQS